MSDKNTHRDDLMEKIVSLCKRRGFVYPGSEVYGGLAGTWDYGPHGLALKENIKCLWRRMFVRERDDVYEIDAAILMNSRVWETSGHAGGFSDPWVKCRSCGHEFRPNVATVQANSSPTTQTLQRFGYTISFGPGETGTKEDTGRVNMPDEDPGAVCPHCKRKGHLTKIKQFNLMFKTNAGVVMSEENTVYLRPETAQGMFVNFKNIVDSFHPKLPFGMAQVGKAFRNEIAPRDFLFRAREFEQMEVEYFVREGDWERAFDEWRGVVRRFIAALGVAPERLHEFEVPDGERAHYSKRTVDFEYDFPFGRKELCGLAYRGDFDLAAHAEASGADLSHYDAETGERFTPHCVEPSLGLDRAFLAALASAYDEDELGGEPRVVLRLPPALAPVSAAVFPLLKNKPELAARAREVYAALKKNAGDASVAFDDNGNIGKRYRRQDEIGTPWCFTVDFQTLGDGTVTARERDSGEQERIEVADLAGFLLEKISPSF